MTHSPIESILLVGIGILYHIFAFQIFSQGVGKNVDWKKASPIIALILVFIICAYSGYLSLLLPECHVTDLIRKGLHWALIVASGWLVVSNQAAIIVKLILKESVKESCDSSVKEMRTNLDIIKNLHEQQKKGVEE